ncbi:hypothetical protein ACVMGC_011505 [Bradyrhizobium barranii subsp. barranii]
MTEDATAYRKRSSMTRPLLVYAAAFLTCALFFAAPGLVEMARVAAWMACRVLNSGACL